MDKEAKKRKKFEASLEGILYELGIFGVEHVEDDKFRIIIAKTLQKIPKEERDNVLFEAIFVVFNDYGREISLFIPNPKGEKMVKQPIIMLNFALMEKESRSESYMMDVVAHETAHFSLGHHDVKAKNLKEHLLMEKEADDLMEKWGFNRTNYDSYKQLVD